MKTLEITVVRTYTTTFDVEVPSDTTDKGIEQALTGGYNRGDMASSHLKKVDNLYDLVWDCLAEQELEQMDTALLNYEIKEL